MMRSLREVALRLVWWTAPDAVLADRKRLVARVMTYGDLEDTKTLWREFALTELLAVLDDPPPGVFSPQAWSYWHVVLGREAPAFESACRRRIPDGF